MATDGSGKRPAETERANKLAALGMSLGVTGGTAVWLLSGDLIWMFLGISLGACLGLLAGHGGGGGGRAEPGAAADGPAKPGPPLS